MMTAEEMERSQRLHTEDRKVSPEEIERRRRYAEDRLTEKHRRDLRARQNYWSRA